MDRKLRQLQQSAQQQPSQESYRALQKHFARTQTAPRIRLYNLRGGFATNSSSSHSIIMAAGLQDSLSEVYDGLGYGWGNFTLASPHEKAKYIAMQFAEHYRRKGLGPEERALVLKGLFPEIAEYSDEEVLNPCNIDHQSIESYGFPDPLNSEYGFKALADLFRKEIINNPEAVILGGNDNSAGHPLAFNPDLPLYSFIDRGTSFYRYDAESDTHTIMSYNGTKVRFGSADNNPQVAGYPELIDLKITDYCGMGCDYCYMDSTRQGKHAYLGTLYDIANNLAGHVFEVAIGGGEPTDHPDFTKILSAFRRRNIIPSFSTQSWKWLEKKEITDSVSKHCGAVALSTQKPEHVVPWIKRLKELEINPHFHYVLGLSPLSNLKEFVRQLRDLPEEIRYTKTHLVLLAHKKVGRAQDSSPYSWEGWQEIVKDCGNWTTVSVDSFLTEEVPEDIPETLYENSDGRYSMYIDAVEFRAAAHSFVDPKDQIPVDIGYWGNGIKNAWDQVRVQ